MQTRMSRPSGGAAAAFLSVALGVAALAVSHLASESSERVKNIVYGFGKLWMPGAEGIGPYSGKETVALVVWLVSWFILHSILRRREVNVRIIGVLWLIGMGIATTLLWPPVVHWMIEK